MIIRFILVIIEILLFYLLQTSVFPYFALAGVVPDLLMILTVSVAFTRGRIQGMLTGLAAGLLMDFCFSSIVGFYGILYLVTGYLAGFSHKIYDRNDYTLPLILVGVSELIYNLLYFVVFYMLQGRLNFGYYMYRFTVPRVIYTVLLSIIIYKLLNMQNVAIMKLCDED